MSTSQIEKIKKEAYYYLGRNISDDEADEIAGYVEDNPAATLEEILSDYYR